MAEESKSQETQVQKETSGGLGLGVDLTVTLSGLRSVVNELNTALQSTGETATNMLSDVFRKIRDIGVESFKSWGREGTEEQQQTYHQVTDKLREAAGRGEQEARNLLSEMGESVEHGGQKMQDVAEEGGAH